MHGDVRLPNILAHQALTGAIDMIKFVDFDWAGLEGKSRCVGVLRILESLDLIAFRNPSTSLLTLPCLSMARYPVLMNPNVNWPAGARPQTLMRQEHDTQLLQAELEKGKQVFVHCK